jgi:hypothetical protein
MGADNRPGVRERRDFDRTKLNELLNKNGLTRHDLPKIMAKIEMQRMAAEQAASAATRAAGWKKEPDANDLGIPGNNLLGLMLTLIEEYIWVTAEERLAIALWILHTYTFRRFRHTPRLLVISPIEDCGKTTVLKVIDTCSRNDSGVTKAFNESIYRH